MSLEALPYPEEDRMSAQNVETIRGIYEAFARGDIPGVIAALADDVEWDSPETLPWGGLARGHDEVLAFFGRLGAAVEEIQADAREFIDSGDQVVVIGAHKGRSKAGALFEADWAMVWTLRDGKAVRFREYVDTASISPAFAGVAV